MTTVPMFRMRAGFYVTRDGAYRIVRRKLQEWQRNRWCVEMWSAQDHRWLRATDRATLQSAREYLALLTSFDELD